jgi:hypothetical protein
MLPATHPLSPLLLALSATLAGCAGSVTCDPAVEECAVGDTAAAFDGDIELLQVDYGCCGPGEDRCPGVGAWWVDVVTEGAPSRVEFTLVEARVPALLGWSESHTVPVKSADPDGYWTDHYLEVEVTRTSDCASLRDCGERFSSGENTLFTCNSDLDAAGMQVLIEVFDATGLQVVCEDAGVTNANAPGCGS